MQQIVVVGAGIAGVESALTFARGLPDARVTLVTEHSSLRIVPNLVYVPFGIDPELVDVQLAPALTHAGVELASGQCTRVDRNTHRVHLASGASLHYDELVLATGAEALPSPGLQLRTLSEALVLRGALRDVVTDRLPRSIVLRALPGATWAAPAVELALLVDTWLYVAERRDDVSVALHVPEGRPLDVLGPRAAERVELELASRGIEVVTGPVPSARSGLPDDVVIDVGLLRARHVPGMPALNDRGFYPTADDGSVAAHVRVVGDAADTTVKAAFATAAQARLALAAIGGDVGLLGQEVDGVPVDDAEYQLDTGIETLAFRMPSAALTSTGVPLHATPSIRYAPPEKLRGTLTRERLLRRLAGRAPAVRFQDALRRASHLRHVAYPACGL